MAYLEYWCGVHGTVSFGNIREARRCPVKTLVSVPSAGEVHVPCGELLNATADEEPEVG